MKLRISGNSIRLRLSMTEVEKLVHGNFVQDKCHIGSSTLTYQVNQNTREDKLSATYSNDLIDVKIPKEWLTNWDKDERVGFEGHDNNGLYILVEKDFQCMKPRPQEDESDLFVNPNANDNSHG